MEYAGYANEDIHAFRTALKEQNTREVSRKLNSEVDELFDELNEYEWEMCRINTIQTILDDWEYSGKKDPKKNWTKINPDIYADLKKDIKKTIESFDGNPETIKKMEEENHEVCEELRKKLEEES